MRSGRDWERIHNGRYPWEPLARLAGNEWKWGVVVATYGFLLAIAILNLK